MSFSQRAGLAGLAVTFALICGCTRNKEGFLPDGQFLAQRSGATFSILVYTDSSNSAKCYVDVKVLMLAPGQKARWISDDNKGYTIDFAAGNNNPPPGTPFPVNGHAPPFPVPAGGHVNSPPASGKGMYQYAIKDAAGKVCAEPGDPGVYVK